MSQGMDREVWPTCVPPLACDRPEFLPYLIAHWAYVLAIHPALVAVRPTYTALSDVPPRTDGGF